ncbi:hypothetical protein [Aquincola sp. J276]|uniref:hypothetical protein n=1 Tax=Aquincola sp. J276 TaxID=2898432 RepID=UPI002151D0EF|nr:hypothetical protein [Aquincola sp. J276]MCR5868695.1 hypothetical protein [Aquincola sp. J276]
MSEAQATEVQSVYRELVKGVGREKVTEANAAQLIELAERDKHTVLAEELREWAMGCGGALTPGQGGDATKG